MMFTAWLLAMGPAMPLPVGQKQGDYLGAHAVLMRMSAPPSGSAMLDPRVIFCDDLEEFARNVEALPADEAAHRWLSLMRRAAELDDKAPDRGSALISEVIRTLPSPEAWPIVAANLAEARSPKRSPALALLFDALTGNDESVRERLKSAPKEFDWNSVKLEYAIRTRDSDAIEEAVKATADEARDNPPFGMRSGPTMELPNLVPLLGPQRAEKVISYILFTAKAELTPSQFTWGSSGCDMATRNLARRIAMANVDRLAWPQWSLATSPDCGDLFLRMTRRFPKVKIGSAMDNPPSWSTLQGAAVSCFANLYSAGQTDRARSFAIANRDTLSLGWAWQSANSGPLVQRLAQSGKLQAFLGLLAALGRKYPDSMLPDLYVSLAQGNRPLEATESFLREALQSAAEGYRKDNLRTFLQRILLREGKLAEAAKVLLTRNQPDPFGSDADLMRVLGTALHRSDLLRRSQALFENAIHEGSIEDSDAVDLLIKRGRGPVLERSLIADLRKSATERGTSSPPAGQLAALALANFYFKVGRFQDVVTLFEKFQLWQAPDFQHLEQIGSDERAMLAKSLARVGRRAEALRIVRDGLQRDDASDDEYQLLLSLDPSGAPSTVDALLPLRPRDCRLLMWKAVCLLRSHRFNEAESVVRHSIATSPNGNGWLGDGIQISPYSVLASILRAQGRSREAKELTVYSQALEHERKAEEFDRQELRQWAISEYRKALSLMPADFYLRMKLGEDELQFGSAAQGRSDIIQAYRHVPPESGVGMSEMMVQLYSNPKAVEIAQAELRSEITGGTKNPMVYACLATAESNLGDMPGAVRDFGKATELDPDCYAAWSALQPLDDWLSTELRSRVSAALARLSGPTLIYANVRVPDYRAAWLARAEKNRGRLHPPRELFVLRASRTVLERSDDQEFISNRAQQLRERLSSTPGSYLAADPLLAAISSSIRVPRER